ncbi:MAG: hypothetical protein JST75_11215 [Bacteroidetes bacterium]|nr:hypothetical protein [Bacteroidota bacterium]
MLAILLPVGIISAWLAIPRQAVDKTLQPAHVNALSVILKSYKKPGAEIVNIRISADSSASQLEWINEETVTSPSALIYQKQKDDNSENITDADLIGRIEARGTYYFPLKNESKNNQFHFVIYDIIHHQVIEKINF